MSFFNSFDISSSALSAQRVRMDVISQNIANATTTRTANGEPYRRRFTVFQEKNGVPFSSYLSEGSKSFMGSGVRVSSIEDDNSPYNMVYNPNHPDADEDGYVRMPNVEIVKEMMDMISATRAYEANVTSFNASKNIAMKALEIGRG